MEIIFNKSARKSHAEDTEYKKFMKSYKERTGY